MIRTTAAKSVLGQKEEIKFLLAKYLLTLSEKPQETETRNPYGPCLWRQAMLTWKAQPLARAERQKADLTGKKLSTKSHMPLKH